MTTQPTSPVIQRLRQAVLRQGGAGMTDGQLLGCFVEHRDETAFTALVRRHGPMVWGVCRRLLPHHDAEDAFQATFLVLARKAASVVPREMVANWLYGVARQTALHAGRTAARRRAREKQVAAMPEAAVAERDDLWHDLQPLLDRELTLLPDKYRVAIVLCDLEGTTRKEAARQLGCPEGTLAARLARARAMLAKRLARHGLAVVGGALTAALSQEASAGVPASVVSATIRVATLVAAGQGAATGAVTAEVAALTAGVLKTMLMSKLKKAAVALLVVFSLMVGAAVIPRTPAAEQPEKAKSVKDAEKALNEAKKALDDAKKALDEAKEKAGKEAGPSAPDKGEARGKTRWEYKALSHDEIKALEFNRRGTDTAEGGLNMLGDEGWELVAIEPPMRSPLGPFADKPALYVFKRPKP
jgi:RNA polymerase sigma factor (sigma-70 family)